MSDQSKAIVDRILAARAAKTPLAIRGGGSKAFYGGAITGEPFDVRGHAGIIDYEPRELVLTVRAGTALTEIEAALAAENQMLPFEPPHLGGGATIGGTVAAGLSGVEPGDEFDVSDDVAELLLTDPTMYVPAGKASKSDRAQEG